jgi:hypothetical protein
MRVEAVYLVQVWVLSPLPWLPFLLPHYQDLYLIPQILLFTPQSLVQCHMVHHPQFLAVTLTNQDMDRVIHQGIIQ